MINREKCRALSERAGIECVYAGHGGSVDEVTMARVYQNGLAWDMYERTPRVSFMYAVVELFRTCRMQDVDGDFRVRFEKSTVAVFEGYDGSIVAVQYSLPSEAVKSLARTVRRMFGSRRSDDAHTNLR